MCFTFLPWLLITEALLELEVPEMFGEVLHQHFNLVEMEEGSKFEV